MRYRIDYQFGKGTTENNDPNTNQDETVLKMNTELFGEKLKDIVLLINFLNSFYDNFCITGSSALMIYAYAYLSEEQFSNIPIPNDIDVLVRPLKGRLQTVDLTSITINNQIYNRLQQSPNRSVTFSNGDKSIDVTITPFSSTNLYGINLISLDELRDFYEDDLNEQKVKLIDQINISNATREISTELKTFISENEYVLPPSPPLSPSSPSKKQKIEFSKESYESPSKSK